MFGNSVNDDQSFKQDTKIVIPSGNPNLKNGRSSIYIKNLNKFSDAVAAQIRKQDIIIEN